MKELIDIGYLDPSIITVLPGTWTPTHKAGLHNCARKGDAKVVTKAAFFILAKANKYRGGGIIP